MSDFAHPETGEILRTHSEFLDAIQEIEERLAPLYGVRRALRKEMAERFPPPEMPRPRERTATQDKVARCPRCGGRVEDDLRT